MSESKKTTLRARGASRRAFLTTLAAGSAAALAAPALALAVDARNKAAVPRNGDEARPAPRPAEIERGIEEQRGYLNQTLEALRGYELPAGTEQAFTFAPLEASRGDRKP